MKKAWLALALLSSLLAVAQPAVKLKKKDRRRDVEMTTTEGVIRLRLSDSTPLHRDNFLRLVKSHFYDSLLFHRVIKNFMAQAGDAASKRATAGTALGSGGLPYTVPAEMVPGLYHKKGALAAARKSDGENPLRNSSGTQFYIVGGRTFTDAELDSVERVRLGGKKIDAARREYYKTTGGTPQLDGSYTVFGEVVSGQEVIDAVVAAPTSTGRDRDRPLKDVRILEVRLVKRKKSS